MFFVARGDASTRVWHMHTCIVQLNSDYGVHMTEFFKFQIREFWLDNSNWSFWTPILVLQMHLELDEGNNLIFSSVMKMHLL